MHCAPGITLKKYTIEAEFTGYKLWYKSDACWGSVELHRLNKQRKNVNRVFLFKASDIFCHIIKYTVNIQLDVVSSSI